MEKLEPGQLHSRKAANAEMGAETGDEDRTL